MNTGADMLFGGADDDTYVNDGTNDFTIVELPNAGIDLVTMAGAVASNFEFNMASTLNVENVFDGQLTWTITGNALNNSITSLQASGLGGQDALVGTALDGGDDQDTLTGMGLFPKLFTIHNQLGGQDTITNFEQGTDFLFISTAEFGGITVLDNGNLFNNATAASGGGDGPELFFDNTTSQLYYDADGAVGGEVLIAILTVITSNLAASDFNVFA